MQFSVKSLCVLLICLSIGFAFYNRQQTLYQARELARTSPLNWKPFSKHLLEEMLSNDKRVLVVFYGHWKRRPVLRLDTEEFRLAVHDNQIELLEGNLHYDILDNSGTLESMKKISRSADSTPFGAIYYPNSIVDTFEWIPNAEEYAANAVKTISQR